MAHGANLQFGRLFVGVWVSNVIRNVMFVQSQNMLM